MAAMEAILTSRRQVAEAMVLEPEEERIPDFMAPPPTKTTGPAAGDGYEIIFQASRGRTHGRVGGGSAGAAWRERHGWGLGARC